MKVERHQQTDGDKKKEEGKHHVLLTHVNNLLNPPNSPPLNPKEKSLEKGNTTSWAKWQDCWPL